MRKRQYVSFFIIVALLCAALTWFLFYQQPVKDELSITFTDQEIFKVGEEIDPVSLVRSSSSAKILYPKIDTSDPGEKQLLYIAVGEHGEQKEFLKTIRVVSPTPPNLILKKDMVTITVGDPFDPDAYIREAKDAYDGKLQVKVTGKYDVHKAGSYTITYTAINSGGMETKKELKLIVKAKEQKEAAPKETEIGNVPETGTNDSKPDLKPNKPNTSSGSPDNGRIWYVKEGYDFEAARSDCMAAGKNVTGSYTCQVVTDENGLGKGYRLIVQ